MKIKFYTLANPDEFRSAVILNYLYKNQSSYIDLNVNFFSSKLKVFKHFIFFRNKNPEDINVVMYPSHILVFYLWLTGHKKIVLDAGWPLSDGEISSRNKKGFLNSRELKFYLLDKFASLLSRIIILESENQRRYFVDKFKVKPEKCKVLYTGLDESKFIVHEVKSFKTPTVTFRGKYNPEAGLEVLADASILLEKENFNIHVYCPNMPDNLVFSNKTKIFKDFINKQEIARILLASDLTLGQLQSHERLSRTIPHKAFESAFLSRAYLTARTNGVSELFQEDKEIMCFNPGDSEDLARKIRELMNDRQKLKSLGISMKQKYNESLSQSKLGSDFLNIMQTLN